MTAAVWWPPIDQRMRTALRVWAGGLDLDAAGCPYDAADKALLASIFSRPETDQEAAGNLELDLEGELNGLLRDWRAWKRNLDRGDPAQMTAFLRLGTTLVEKLTELRASHDKEREYERFRAVVVEILDQILEPQQKAFLDRLKAHPEAGG